MSNDSTMTPEERAKLIGGDLTTSTEKVVNLCFPDKDQAPEIVGDWLAHLLGRVTVLAAGTIVALERRLSKVEREAQAAHARSNGNAARVSQAHMDIGAVSDRVHAVEDMQQRYLDIAHGLAVEVERLKERQAGSDGEQ